MKNQVYKMHCIGESNHRCYTTASEIGNWLLSKGLILYQDDYGCYHFGSQINKTLENANRQLLKAGLYEDCIEMNDYPKLIKRAANGGIVNKAVFIYFKDNNIDIPIKTIGNTGCRGADLYTEDAIKILSNYLHISYDIQKDVEDIKCFDKPFVLETSKRKQRKEHSTIYKGADKLF